MESGEPWDTAEAAHLDENAAELTLTAFCWWRPDLPQDVCADYWRDVHGIMFARAPGMWQCRQFRLAANRPDLWPAVRGVSFDAPDEAQPQGMSRGLFLSRADLDAFAGHPIARETIPHDARTFLGRIGAQLTPPGSGRTLVDRVDGPAEQGAPPVPTFVLCFVPQAGAVSTEAFHRHLTEQVARPWSRHPGVMRLRVEPLPPYDLSAMSSPGVPHRWPTEETYLGWIELAVRHESVLGELLKGAVADEFARHVAAVHTFPVREVYTLISEGRPTEVGLRGYPAVRTIVAAGADHQRGDALLTALFGDIVHGLDQLGP